MRKPRSIFEDMMNKYNNKQIYSMLYRSFFILTRTTMEISLRIFKNKGEFPDDERRIKHLHNAIREMGKALEFQNDEQKLLDPVIRKGANKSPYSIQFQFDERIFGVGRLYVDNRVELIELLRKKGEFTINEVVKEFGPTRQLAKDKDEEYTVREYIENLALCFIVRKGEDKQYTWVGG
jgi:hypothetical protein